jgi:hypothetical protein
MTKGFISCGLKSPFLKNKDMLKSETKPSIYDSRRPR